MSNLSELYHNATRLKEVIKDENQPDQPIDYIAKLSWLTHPGTKDYFEEIGKEIEQLMAMSIALAVNYPQTKNHEQIIANLIRIDCLKKQIAYGR